MEHKRKIGLDYVRVFAMFLVVFCHSGCFSIGQNPRIMEFSGILAVELFFTLSGFLVGKTMIRSVTAPNSRDRMKRFYINRFFRIAPLYYIMLFVTMLITGKNIPLSCFFFLQNFNPESINFFPHAWSLSIEFWFYFLVSTCFLLLYRQFKHLQESKAVFLSLGILSLIFFALRVYFSFSSELPWDYGLRKQIFLRMDALLLGVLLAAIKKYKKERYEKTASNNLYFILSIVGILILYLFYFSSFQKAALDASPFHKIAFFTILPILSCTIVGYMDQFTHFFPCFSIFNGFIEKISKLSYSVYLIHLDLFWVVSACFVDSSYSMSCLGFLGSVLLTGLLAVLTYRFVEIPSEKLKNRILTARECIK